MTNEQIREIGLEQLAKNVPQSDSLSKWKTWLTDYQFNDECPDDGYVWLTCILALEGVNTGNDGVGAILLDGDGNIVSQGHNETFKPYFRSDLHAEMVVMNKFEDSHKEINNLKNKTLYTSYEPCPMCLTRLIISGVNRVLCAVQNMDDGLFQRMEDLPKNWIDLAKWQDFGQASCSQALTDAAKDIFYITDKERKEKLTNRRR